MRLWNFTRLMVRRDSVNFIDEPDHAAYTWSQDQDVCQHLLVSARLANRICCGNLPIARVYPAVQHPLRMLAARIDTRYDASKCMWHYGDVSCFERKRERERDREGGGRSIWTMQFDEFKYTHPGEKILCNFSRCFSRLLTMTLRKNTTSVGSVSFFFIATLYLDCSD